MVTSSKQITIGPPSNFWVYNPTTRTFDLTHPSPSSSPCSSPLTIQTTTNPILIDPAVSALIIIDMQNYFLSPSLNRSKTPTASSASTISSATGMSPGHTACHNLVTHAIPAARKAGIQIIWLNWGLTEEDLAVMPPGVTRAFGFEGSGGEVLDKFGKVVDEGKGKGYAGLGSESRVPVVEVLEEGEGKGGKVEVGRLLMRGTWNAGSYGPLKGCFEEGRRVGVERPDVWIHKNRMSGMVGESECDVFLREREIKTLFFTGVNTDQCVGGTYQDCFSKGYDCVMLSDGCGTTSPSAAQECFEYNAANTWGFCVSCEAFAEGVKA